jgi:hypothetical protein
VNPYDIIGLKKLVQFRGEDLVDPHIAAEIAAGEFRQIQPVVKNRPEHSVGVPIVIFPVVLFDQISQHIRLMTALDRPRVHPILQLSGRSTWNQIPDVAARQDVSLQAPPDCHLAARDNNTIETKTSRANTSPPA